MHYHCEIIIPPVKNIKSAVMMVMEPFSDRDGEGGKHSFWDWWVIGGRWTGEKVIQRLGRDRIDKFYRLMTMHNITVSGLRSGKQRLEPQSQIPLVDNLWNECFPDSPFNVCPLFGHFDDQYQDSINPLDVAALKDIGGDFKCDKVIITGCSPNKKNFRPQYMISTDFYNGVSYIKSVWDGRLGTALEAYKKYISTFREDWREEITPKDDWLVVTVDYHS